MLIFPDDSTVHPGFRHCFTRESHARVPFDPLLQRCDWIGFGVGELYSSRAIK